MLLPLFTFVLGVVTPAVNENTDLFFEPLSVDQKQKAQQWVSEFSQNQRGPYQGITWRCNDGVLLTPKLNACVPHGGGIMYGVLAPNAEKLAAWGLFVGTVLAPTHVKEFIDNNRYRSRAFIVEAFLERALDGWSLRAAKSYRGFKQLEDEQKTSRLHLITMMQDPEFYEKQRSLALRLMRAMPYGQGDERADEIRALATVINDADRRFDTLRFKIHAMPEPKDADAVEAYAADANTKPEQSTQAKDLAQKIRAFYDVSARLVRLKDIKKWVRDDILKKAIDKFIGTDPQDVSGLLTNGVDLMQVATQGLKPIKTSQQGERNLLRLQTMLLVEQLWLGLTAPLSQAKLTRQQLLTYVESLFRGAQFLGLLSTREAAMALEAVTQTRSGKGPDFVRGVAYLQRALEWARARVLADVGWPLARYAAVEPRAQGVVDDILRSSVMLPLATLLDRVAMDADRVRGGGHKISGAKWPAGAWLRGENPGIAKGVLRFVGTDEALAQLTRDDIAVLYQLPPDLPPVAGILTVGPAGSLSHVSLLARNLGIPNAAVSGDGAEALRVLAGQQVVYGVTSGRRVLLQPFADLPATEQKRFQSKTTNTTLTIDAARLDLNATNIRPLSEVSEKDIGARLGPKAGELGRLKRLFGERVSDAAVIPFGAFVKHADQTLASAQSPLQRLRAAYEKAKGKTAEEAEQLLLPELAAFRQALDTMPFPPGFEAEVEAALRRLGDPDKQGVYVRSDTNVEDLKDFTGAGLNLTVFNQVGLKAVLASIRQVWASPYSERSYRWRQRLLSNPEHVYPSVILHKTVASEMSGVMVTTDLEGAEAQAITVSIGEGVSAVVDGGAPETVVLTPGGGLHLLTSCRSISRKVIPKPPKGGVATESPMGMEPLVDRMLAEELFTLASEVQSKMPQQATPWDIEFGTYRGKVYLMQIRPLKISQSAAVHPYLTAIDAAAPAIATTLDLSAEVL